MFFFLVSRRRKKNELQNFSARIVKQYTATKTSGICARIRSDVDDVFWFLTGVYSSTECHPVRVGEALKSHTGHVES